MTIGGCVPWSIKRSRTSVAAGVPFRRIGAWHGSAVRSGRGFRPSRHPGNDALDHDGRAGWRGRRLLLQRCRSAGPGAGHSLPGWGAERSVWPDRCTSSDRSAACRHTVSMPSPRRAQESIRAVGTLRLNRHSVGMLASKLVSAGPLVLGPPTLRSTIT